MARRPVHRVGCRPDAPASHGGSRESPSPCLSCRLRRDHHAPGGRCRRRTARRPGRPARGDRRGDPGRHRRQRHPPGVPGRRRAARVGGPGRLAGQRRQRPGADRAAARDAAGPGHGHEGRRAPRHRHARPQAARAPRASAPGAVPRRRGGATVDRAQTPGGLETGQLADPGRARGRAILRRRPAERRLRIRRRAARGLLLRRLGRRRPPQPRAVLPEQRRLRRAAQHLDRRPLRLPLHRPPDHLAPREPLRRVLLHRPHPGRRAGPLHLADRPRAAAAALGLRVRRCRLLQRP